MALRRAFIAVVGAATELPIRLGKGYTSLVIIPLTTTVDLQLSFEAAKSNEVGKYVTLEDGRSVALDHLWDGSEDAELYLYAGSAVNVSVIAWQASK